MNLFDKLIKTCRLQDGVVDRMVSLTGYKYKKREKIQLLETVLN
jgi:hypothetical protein